MDFRMCVHLTATWYGHCVMQPRFIESQTKKNDKNRDDRLQWMLWVKRQVLFCLFFFFIILTSGDNVLVGRLNPLRFYLFPFFSFSMRRYSWLHSSPISRIHAFFSSSSFSSPSWHFRSFFIHLFSIFYCFGS